MITHQEALNELLSFACVKNEGENGINTYWLDLCCHEMFVYARPLGDGQYEIERVEMMGHTKGSPLQESERRTHQELPPSIH